jgi:hypothetical protein
MGAAVNWQDQLISLLEPIQLSLTVFNPRRKDWDSSWEQKIDNPHFFNQVTWELDALDAAEEIVMYFDPNTKSPITLLELGLYADGSKLTVICPDGFWRKGNVDIVCKRYGIQQMDSIEDYVADLRSYIT